MQENNNDKGLLDELLIEYEDSLKYEDVSLTMFIFGKILFAYCKYKEALLTFAKLYNLGLFREDIINIVFDCYYEPNKKSFEDMYSKNISYLKKYNSFYALDIIDLNDLRYTYIPIEESKYIVFDNKENKFENYHVVTKNMNNLNKYLYNSNIDQEVYMITNYYNAVEICENEEIMKEPEFLNMKTVIYLFYSDDTKFFSLLQLFDFTPLLQIGKAVFLIGENSMDIFNKELQMVFPTKFLTFGFNQDIIISKLNKINSNMNGINNIKCQQIKDYYSNLDMKRLINLIENKQIKILFITSRFTTALQYYTRDCIEACKELKINTSLLIEKNDIYRVTRNEFIDRINSFKPDIIFTIDHYRWEYSSLNIELDLLDKICFITWEQDNLPHMLSKMAAKRLGANDIVFNQQYDNMHTLINKYEYDKSKMFSGPVPGNPHIYKKYNLTDKEYKEYNADICYFANTGNSKLAFDNLINKEIKHICQVDIKDSLVDAYNLLYDMTYNQNWIYNDEEYIGLIERIFIKNRITNLEIDVIKKIGLYFKKQIGYRLQREIPLIWLHEKGYNMNLWGVEWVEHKILGKYAKGVAQNGEILSKIINASKIVLGLSPVVTCHPRIAETFLSETMCIIYNIPEEYDLANIRKYLSEEHGEVVIAYDKKDLIKKIDYYLDNNEERSTIINNGKAAIINNLTFDSIMQNMLNKTKDYYKHKYRI